VSAVRWSIAAVSVGSLLSATACSPDAAAPATTPEPAPTTSVALEVAGDGVLTIGELLPSDDTILGAPLSSAASVAIERINAAGGVLGRPVEVVVADEGETTASASESIQALLDGGVDAIVGPASSLVALSTLDQIVDAGVVSCSPTASAMSLDTFPDNGLFFRTVPSDSLLARAIGEAAIQTGALRAGIVHVDDGYGRDLADAVTSTLVDGAMAIGDTIPISGLDDDLTAEAQQLIDSGANVAVVLAGEDEGIRFLSALDALDSRGLATVIVNDALRSPTEPQRIAALGDQLRGRIVGLAPSGPFATNAYDCVNLLALATVRAGSDAPRAIAEQVSSVSSSGSACSAFADCLAAIEEGLQVDYDGPTGVTEISSRDGDPARAVFDRFRFGDDGLDVLERQVVVG
jgi:branched-chain amino acid transport system substrate-binding protein